jgi:formate dehydrogenase alpha subunit
MANGETIKIEFNGREVTAPAGVTVLRAAELNDVWIPTLCSHKDLSPYGGCRMCLVEIEGMRGYPLACNTLAADGMKVVTDTVAIQEMRREVLQLILSEHPSSCLICGEAEECKTFQGTVRKSGVTTGCRFCPNDGQCELQDLVERLEIKEINYPIIYRGFEAERSDPFYDRDYNLCILCGRCVRMCQEMRGTAVLAFNYRGPKAVVGPAFGRNHLEAGCEFCGACVSVCPTGALYEKASKWNGKPDESLVATCPFCAIGCRLEFQERGGRFSHALPVLDPEVNDGQACVKGRFCIGEVSHHFTRARKPMTKVNGFWREITWDEAIEKAADVLKDTKPDEFSMIVSPDLTNESLYTAQKFARVAMDTNSIDSTARRTLSGRLGMWAELFSRPVSIQGLNRASRILAIGLDTRFNFSIIGVEIRKAMQKGAKLVTIDPRESNLARYADIWLQPPPGFEGTLLKALATGDKKEIKKAAGDADVDTKSLEKALDLLESGDDLTIVIGPSVFRYSSVGELVKGISDFAMKENVGFIPLYNGTNTRGAMEMGAFPELLPGSAGREGEDAVEKFGKIWGGELPTDKGVTVDDIIDGSEHPKVLWLVGAVPFFERPDCDFLIVQDIYEPDFDCDLYLPASSFLESAGTLINVEGRVQDTPRTEELPDSVQYGRARPDWQIISNIARKLGAKGFDFETSDDVLAEIATGVPDFPRPGAVNRVPRVFERPATVPVPNPGEKKAAASKGKFLLVLQPEGYTHRGISITSKVEGLQILDPENGFYVSSDDAEKLGVCEGDTIVVKSDGVEGRGQVRIQSEIPSGVIYLYVPDALGGLADRRDLEQLYRLERNPVPVEVKKSAL